MKTSLILGTRASPLATAQSQWVAEQLRRLHPELQIRLRKISTEGDRIQDRVLSRVGGKGLFVKEIEAALLAGEIDLAVHSLKDMPAELPAGLRLGATPSREDPGDVLLSRDAQDLVGLPKGAVVGTSSLRRRLQMVRVRPDLRFEPLRGNIDSRVKRLQNGDFGAIVLAKAGLRRLGLSYPHCFDLTMIPAPGQGTLAIEIRENDTRVSELLGPLHDDATFAASEAERRVMRALGGNCNLPLGAYGSFDGVGFRLRAFIATLDGNRWIEEEMLGRKEESMKIAEAMVEEFWRQGAKQIVEEIEKAIGE